MQSFTNRTMQRMNNLVSKLMLMFPWLNGMACRLPLSPFRGIVWHLLDESAPTILDVGIFRGAMGRLIRIREKERHYVVGVDIYRPYLNRCKQIKIYDELVLADGRYLPFRNGAFYIVVALEVIEHLPKEDAMIFLGELERLAKRQVTISTPVGFMEIDNLDSESQRHLSGYFPSEFRKLGWKIRGTYGIRLFPNQLAYYISFLLPFSYYAPTCAYNMTCVKRSNVETDREVIAN